MQCDLELPGASLGSQQQVVLRPIVIELWPHESECVACGRNLYGCKQGIPMYGGEPVPHDYTGDWAGFDACRECFDAYTAAQAVEKNLREWWKSVRQRRPQNMG